MDIRKEKIRESLSTFSSLEHRMEYVATVRGVDFINDSKATNVNSVWFALESMKNPTVLILGGQDKGNDYNEIMDLVKEAHDTHHTIAASLYYEDQKVEAVRAASCFIKERMPKFLGYFEDVLAKGGKAAFLAGRALSYADLSLFQVVEGLRYAFPRAMAAQEKKLPRTAALHDRVGERPKITAYLSSSRRIPFNQHGIFRHYPELDA